MEATSGIPGDGVLVGGGAKTSSAVQIGAQPTSQRGPVRFGCRASRRRCTGTRGAPVNLTPIAGLERHLHRLQGSYLRRIQSPSDPADRTGTISARGLSIRLSTRPTGPASMCRTTRPAPSSASWSRTAGRSWRAGRPTRTDWEAGQPELPAPAIRGDFRGSPDATVPQVQADGGRRGLPIAPKRLGAARNRGDSTPTDPRRWDILEGAGGKGPET